MAHDVEVQKAVRQAYVFDRLSLEMAAERAGVSFGTARRWKAAAEKNGDNWKKLVMCKRWQAVVLRISLKAC